MISPYSPGWQRCRSRNGHRRALRWHCPLAPLAHFDTGVTWKSSPVSERFQSRGLAEPLPLAHQISCPASAYRERLFHLPMSQRCTASCPPGKNGWVSDLVSCQRRKVGTLFLPGRDFVTCRWRKGGYGFLLHRTVASELGPISPRAPGFAREPLCFELRAFASMPITSRRGAGH